MTRTTNSGQPPHEPDDSPVPNRAKLPDGQHVDHWVLSVEDRAGFVRPVRYAYLHVGIPGPKYPLRDLTAEEHARYDRFGYAKFEAYPESESPVTGSYWTQARLDSVGRGCGTKTSMSRAIAETYAKNPRYYGSTFCCGCGKYFAVGEAGEFIWDGTNERVGT